jgi:hypothetical protein
MIALGAVAAAALLALLNFMVWLFRDGIEAAINVDGGGASTFGILLLVSAVGLIIGVPIAAVVRGVAARSILANAGGFLLFAVAAGRLNSSPIFSVDAWIQGGYLAAGYAALAIGIAWLVERSLLKPPMHEAPDLIDAFE